MKKALILIRLARYVLRRISKAEGPGQDMAQYRGVLHQLIQVLRDVLTGAVDADSLNPLFEYLDKAARDGKIDGRADASGKGGRWGIMRIKGHRCPVCGKYSFPGEYSTYESCEVCGWMDDRTQESEPDWDGCANIMSLNEARKAYAEGREIQ